MAEAAEMQLLYRVGNAAVQNFPFPHIYVRDLFPADFYRRLRQNLPSANAYTTLRKLNRVRDDYPDSRVVLPLETQHLSALDEPQRSFWQALTTSLRGPEFGSLILSRFQPALEQRFGSLSEQQFAVEALLVRDHTTYRLPPHTDSPTKVVSLLFYLPQDDNLAHLGTSIYLPKTRKQTTERHACASEQFDRLFTMPYTQNTLFAFVNTPNAIHGVEPITEGEVCRDLLLYDIKVHGTTQRPAMVSA